MRINEGGHFAPGGYVFDNQSKFIEHYTGLDDIPEEYCISHVQARDEKEETRSILETIKQFKEDPPVPMRNGRPRAKLARGSTIRAAPRGPPDFPKFPGGKEAVCRNM